MSFVYYIILVVMAVTVEFDPTSYAISESDHYANITIVKRNQTSQTVSVTFMLWVIARSTEQILSWHVCQYSLTLIFTLEQILFCGYSAFLS